MTEKDRAKELVDHFRIVLMNEDTDCGNEILCTIIAKGCAKIACNEVIKTNTDTSKYGNEFSKYWNKVLKEIEVL
jgi:hypothetical protein